MFNKNAFICSSEERQKQVDSLLFRKEIVRSGSYHDPKSDSWYDISDKDLDHWAEQFEQFRDAEIRVPILKDQNEDSESALGEVVGMERVDDKLFAYLKYADEEAAKIALRNDVSIYSPRTSKKSDGKEYSFPIEHVAVTPFPVVRGLGGHEAIAASLSDPSQRSEPNMDQLQLIADVIGLKFDDGIDDDAKIEKIGGHFEKQKEVIASLTPKDEFKFSITEGPGQSLAKQIKSNTKTQVEAFVKAGKLSTPAAEDLLKLSTSDEALTFAINGEHSLPLDQVFDLIDKNTVRVSEDVEASLQVLDHSNNRDANGRAKHGPLAYAQRRLKGAVN